MITLVVTFHLFIGIILLWTFLLVQHLFIEKSGRKKKQQLNVIQSKEQYADEVDHQHDDDDIQETPGTDLLVIVIKYLCNWDY